MKYIVNNKAQMASQLQAVPFEEKVNQLLAKTEHFSSSYNKPLVLEINFSEEGNEFLLSFETKLKASTVHVSKKGTDVNEVFDLLSDTYLRGLKRQIHKERKEQRRKRQQASAESIEQVLMNAGISRETSQKEFSEKLGEALQNEIVQYVHKRLQKAEAANLIDQNKYTVDDIVDQVYLRVYETAVESAFNLNMKNIALKAANEIMRELFQEHNFEQNHVLHLEQQLAREQSKLTEKVYIDARGKSELEAEFVEPSCHVNYHAEDVFDDSEEELIHNIDLEMGRDKVKERLAIEVMKLSPLEHAIYDHAIIEEMAPEDIASIYNMPIAEVEQTLVSVKTHLRHALEGTLV